MEVTKRLISKFGFEAGNTVQGIFYGLLHGIMFISLIGLFKGIVVSLFTGVLGTLLGWINEKHSGGWEMSLIWTRNSYSLILDDKKKSTIPLSKGRIEEPKRILNI